MYLLLYEVISYHEVFYLLVFLSERYYTFLGEDFNLHLVNIIIFWGKKKKVRTNSFLINFFHPNQRIWSIHFWHNIYMIVSDKFLIPRKDEK